MIKVIAEIELFGVRKTPFLSGYRPLFNFVPSSKLSGQITLLDRNAFRPHETGLVEISYLKREFLGSDFAVGTEFTFDEGFEVLGKGIVREIIEQ